MMATSLGPITIIQTKMFGHKFGFTPQYQRMTLSENTELNVADGFKSTGVAKSRTLVGGYKKLLAKRNYYK